MNVERLHAIVNALREELAHTDAQSLLSQLAAPRSRTWPHSTHEPSQQQAAATARTQLDEVLTNAPSNDFSPAGRRNAEGPCVDTMVGEGLRDRVEAILNRSGEITPGAIPGELLQPLLDEQQHLSEALAGLKSGFDFFHIGAEELPAGEFEIGFLIPRDAVDDELGRLGKEFLRLKRILGPFVELETGGSRPEFEVRSISPSSMFQVFLLAAPGMALTFAKTLESLLSSYEKVLKLRTGPRGSGGGRRIPDDAGWCEGRCRRARWLKEIKRLVEKLLARSDIAEERLNELRLRLLTDGLNGPRQPH